MAAAVETRLSCIERRPHFTGPRALEAFQAGRPSSSGRSRASRVSQTIEAASCRSLPVMSEPIRALTAFRSCSYASFASFGAAVVRFRSRRGEGKEGGVGGQYQSTTEIKILEKPN